MAESDEAAVHWWTVDAPVLVVPPKPPIAYWTISLSLPPTGGSGVEVCGLDVQSVPGSLRFNNGAVETPTLRLTGMYDGRRLTLTEPPFPVEVEGKRVPADAPTGTACPDAGDGAFTTDQRAAAVAYSYAQSDLGKLWMSDHERVLNVAFAGDLPRHEQAIRALYPGPLCVVETPASAAELEVVRRRLHADADLEALHLQVLQTSTSSGTLHVVVVAADEEQIALLRDRYGPHVQVRSWLRPVPFARPTAEDLSSTPSA